MEPQIYDKLGTQIFLGSNQQQFNESIISSCKFQADRGVFMGYLGQKLNC